jgi:hypothetical protein
MFFLPTDDGVPGRPVKFSTGFSLKPEPGQSALDFATFYPGETDLVFGLLISFFGDRRRVGGRRLFSWGGCQTRFGNLRALLRLPGLTIRVPRHAWPVLLSCSITQKSLDKRSTALRQKLFHRLALIVTPHCTRRERVFA